MKFGSRKNLAVRAGFTLVELLVVISIIGMLMALLFPAINAARESGRQNTCRNNMRSVLTAMVAYEAKKNAFPMLVNTIESVPRPLVFAILPDLERNDIYNAARTNAWTIAQLENQQLYLEFLQCPSNPLTRTGDDAENMAFVFNAGRHSLYNSASGTAPELEKYAGMFFEAGSPNSSADLTSGDGAVNTLLVSESLYNPATGPKWTLATTGGTTDGTTELRNGFTWAATPATGAGINRRPTVNGVEPSSNHPGIVNVGFADSHVRVLSEAIDYAVYSQLCTPRGATFGQLVLSEGAY